MGQFFKSAGAAVLLSLMVLGTAPATADDYEGIEITVNINTANAEELDKLLLGIGPDKALRIIEYRQQHGPFSVADDLSKVKGIGASTVEKNRERIKL